MSLISSFWPEPARQNPTVNGLALALVTADTGARAYLEERDRTTGSYGRDRPFQNERGPSVGQRVTVVAKDRNAMMRGRQAVVEFLRSTLPTGFSYDDVNGRRTWQDKDGNWVTSMYW